jgi:hypothetical protein
MVYLFLMEVLVIVALAEKQHVACAEIMAATFLDS